MLHGRKKKKVGEMRIREGRWLIQGCQPGASILHKVAQQVNEIPKSAGKEWRLRYRKWICGHSGGRREWDEGRK